MAGYCSNSPLRCHNARLMVKLYQADNYCPECGLSLVIANDLMESAVVEQRVLILCLILLSLFLVILSYIYYDTLL